MPRTFARTGAIGNFYFVGQWFPKIGVLEDTGWNCHQFHSATEFFADFGTYDVRLTVPQGWIVGATGVERDRRDEADGRPRRIIISRTTSTISPGRRARITSSGTRRFEHPTLPPVDMRLLLQPEHAGQADRHFAAARAALKYYGEWFGPYPYGHLTIVDPAWQSGAAGMEYPTLITAGTRWLAPADTNVPEGVAVHEAGHQFWYGIVATNEFEHAWMDEGFNTYSTARVAGAGVRAAPTTRSATSAASSRGCSAIFRSAGRSKAIGCRPTAGVRTGDAQSTRNVASVLAGSRGADHLRQDRAVAAHARADGRLADAAAHPVDLLFALGIPSPETAGLLRRRQRSQRPRSDLVLRPGVPRAPACSTTASSRLRASRTSRAAISATARADGSPRPRGTRAITSPRSSCADWATASSRSMCGVVFENKEEVRWHWDGRDRWKMFEVVKPARASFAQVDPDHVLLLDVQLHEQLGDARARRRAAAARKWSLAWLVWLQDHLLTYGFFV